ncbi:hypothetical protein [Absidia glauca]|uniref:Uncharacterized protein n=1 Tax=Absidia glauca TaxID=4829 RepID=A0A163IVN9_ABSGL|nr:hypothetical protein [Absidia glauca]
MKFPGLEDNGSSKIPQEAQNWMITAFEDGCRGGGAHVECAKKKWIAKGLLRQNGQQRGYPGPARVTKPSAVRSHNEGALINSWSPLVPPRIQYLATPGASTYCRRQSCNPFVNFQKPESSSQSRSSSPPPTPSPELGVFDVANQHPVVSSRMVRTPSYPPQGPSKKDKGTGKARAPKEPSSSRKRCRGSRKRRRGSRKRRRGEWIKYDYLIGPGINLTMAKVKPIVELSEPAKTFVLKFARATRTSMSLAGTFLVMIDSGASDNYASSRLIPVAHNIKTVDGPSVETAGGEIIKIDKKIQLQVLFDGFEVSVDAHVFDSKFDLILGRTWLNQLNPVADWQDIWRLLGPSGRAHLLHPVNRKAALSPKLRYLLSTKQVLRLVTASRNCHESLPLLLSLRSYSSAPILCSYSLLLFSAPISIIIVYMLPLLHTGQKPLHIPPSNNHSACLVKGISSSPGLVPDMNPGS